MLTGSSGKGGGGMAKVARQSKFLRVRRGWGWVAARVSA